MRPRSVVLVPALAVAAAVLPATPAGAAPAQCSLVLPSRVVVDSPTESIPVRLSSNCAAADAASSQWDVLHSRVDIGWYADFADGATALVLEHRDTDPAGRYDGYPVQAVRADSAPLTQNQPRMLVKYGSRLAASATRASGALTWSATATVWSGRAHRWYPRASAKVSLWHLPTGSSTWRWVKAVTTTRKGTATISLGAPRPGRYRLGVGETPTVWASYSRPVRGA